jgi:hypothetical protein
MNYIIYEFIKKENFFPIWRSIFSFVTL